MQQSNTPRAWRRALSLLLALTLMLGLAPGFPGASETASAHWADPYLSQLVEWGFIREDQAGYPDRALTRADFMAIVNRAYGYHETGETPFEDVAEEDWYYDDVGIAYNARYIHGTSPTTASPKEALTRETAATILGRNMMLEESAGELLDFTDARQISSWAKGTIKSSLEHYLVSGYDDGTFRPQRNVSWGEMASMVTALVGTPLQESGEYSLGGVYGNVTITSPDVTLRDTVISGDLYITGGVGLGGIELENVTVLGRIIASGTGQAEGGQDSILLRNVTADELLVDNLQDNYVSLRADGVTEIGKTTVRTSAYIEDNTPDGLGLQYISLEGESYPEGEEPEGWTPIQLDLAGRIGEVVNRTPGSQVRAASGTVAKLTVDEAAVGSTVVIDRGAVVKELNLDTATLVTGEGDIEHLTVNAPGCEVEMLPDQIDIRPGITAIIAGEEMDSVAAKESSEQPMILAGYPQAQDIVPTGLDAAFMTNKAGTVYWAVSALTDGSVGEEDLIKPPSYGNIAVRNGSVKVAQGNEETISKVTGLTPGGSYYLSAVLVDARGQRSAVKVISFTTPDNTVPAFNSGYPRMSKVSRTDSVVVVMPNKDCKLYYALLPESATAPTEDELKSSAVAGALGYGVRDVKKNVEDAFRVNDVILEEETTYVLYLWLTDADGVNKSKITTLKFTTDDDTPPDVTLSQRSSAASSVTLEYQITEPGTIYWVAFPSGVIDYPKRDPNDPTMTGNTAPLNSSYAIQQVVNGSITGTSDGKSGRVSVKGPSKGSDSTGNIVGTFNISGLKAETPYDVYYVAKDNAGPDRNYSVTVKKITVTPTDSTPPVITQSFSHILESKEPDKNPYADTAIYLDITENVCYDGSRSFIDLYNDYANASGDAQRRAQNLWASTLHNAIKLMQIDSTNNVKEVDSITNLNQLSSSPFDDQPDVTIDYTQATAEYYPKGGKSIRITFPASGLHLDYGGHYYFTVEGLEDTAGTVMEPAGSMIDFWHFPEESAEPGHQVKDFMVQFASVELSLDPVITGGLPIDVSTGKEVLGTKSVKFRMAPNSTGDVDDIYSYDIVIWTDNEDGIAYDLYYRVVDKKNQPVFDYDEEKKTGSYREIDGSTDYLLAGTEKTTEDPNGWVYLGASSPPPSLGKDWVGRSVNQFFNHCDEADYTQLNTFSDELYYDFVISITQFDGKTDASTWRGPANFYVNVAAGQATNLINLPARPDTDDWDELEEGQALGGLQSIGHWNNWESGGSPAPDTLKAFRNLSPTGLPSFINPAPTFTTTSDGVTVNLGLSDAGDIYWAISEVGENGQANATTYRAVMKADLNDDGSPKEGVELVDGKFTNAYFINNDAVKTEFADKLDAERRLMAVSMNDPQPPQDGGITSTRPISPWMKGGGPTDESVVDDRMLDNLIVSPTNQTIINKFRGEGEDKIAAADSFTPATGGLADYELPATLKPDTDYFIYFVITLPDKPNDMSHVYIYHFKTKEPVNPWTEIKLPGRGDSGDVDMGVGNEVIGKNSTANWRVYTLSDATNGNISILRKPFALFTAHKGENEDGNSFIDKDGSLTVPDRDTYNSAPGSDKTPYIYLVDEDGEPFTVLDALTTDYASVLAKSGLTADQQATFYFPTPNEMTSYDKGYTVFDMYADSNARVQVYTLVERGVMGAPESVNVADPGPSGSNDMKKAELSNEYYYNLQEISKTPFMQNYGSTRFLFLMTAENPNMLVDKNAHHSTIASFRAKEFWKSDFVAPEATGGGGGVSLDANGRTYSGRVTVTFDRDTYLAQPTGSNSLEITTENLFKGQYDVTFPIKPGSQEEDKDAMRPQTVQPKRFTLLINGVQSGAQGTLTFPEDYFASISNIAAGKALDITIDRHPDHPNDGKLYLLVKWGGEVIYESEVTGGASADYDLILGGGIQGGKFDPHLDLDLDTSGKESAKITAEMSPPNLTGTQYKWSMSNADVVSLPAGSTSWDSKNNETTITAERPGTVTVTADGRGTDDSNDDQSASNSFLVTVTGSVNDFAQDSVVSNSSGAKWTANNTFEMTAGSVQTVTLNVKANGKDLAANTTVANPGSIANVTCTPNGRQITITSGRNVSAGTVVKVPIGLTSGGKDVTPDANDKKEITITFVAASTRNNAPASARAVKPTGLTISRVSGPAITSKAMKMTGTSLTATVKATITPSGASGTVTWTSSDPNVASVTGSGMQAVIQGLSAGTAVITAMVSGEAKDQITVTVSPTVTISSFTANSTASTIKAGTDGNYTWTRKSGTSCAATLKFTTGRLSMDNAEVTVTSSDPKAVSVREKITKSGTTGQAELTFGAMNAGKQVTITVKVGTMIKSFKINLVGSDVVL